jgi:hypothetical protein
MGRAIEIKLEGLDTTLRRLQAFPVKVQKKCLRSAVASGAVPLVRAVKSASPQRTGIFRRSIAAKVKGYQAGAVYVSIVGQADKIRSSKKVRAVRGGISGRGQIVPIHFVEEGTKPHGISRRFMRALGFTLSSGQIVFRGAVQHPGHAGRHIIRKAAETAGREAADRVERKLGELIDKLEVTA